MVESTCSVGEEGASGVVSVARTEPLVVDKEGAVNAGCVSCQRDVLLDDVEMDASMTMASCVSQERGENWHCLPHHHRHHHHYRIHPHPCCCGRTNH